MAINSRLTKKDFGRINSLVNCQEPVVRSQKTDQKAATKNDVDYNYVAYLFRHFDPEEREESLETSGDTDKKAAETEVGSDDCSVSVEAFENIEPGQVARNERNEAEVGSEKVEGTFADDVDNTKSVHNGRSFPEQDEIDSNQKMEETGLSCGHTERTLQGRALVVLNEETNRS